MNFYYDSDIKKMNALYNRTAFSFVFLYGRYGTGKTSLLRSFCRDKRTLFFSAQEALPARQLEQFHQEVCLFLKPAKQPPVFSSWEQAFSYVADFSFQHRLVFILDEIQMLTQHDPDFLPAFSEAVKHALPSGKVFLIVTSSSPAFAREVMLDSVQDPFQAVTARANLGVLPFSACQSAFPHGSSLDQLLLYGATGGLPSCLKYADSQVDASENVIRMFFRPDSPLLTSPLADLYRELRELSTYNYLLEIMAHGCTKLTDIAEKASMGTNKCAKYLNTLIALGILEKEFPACSDTQKRVRYTFSDHMTRFWYRFVYPNLSSILFGKGAEVFHQQVKPQLAEYLLPVFETICTEYLEKLGASGQTPFVYRHTGSWWTGGTKREAYFRIPLVAADHTHAVLGLCHCSKEPAGISLLESLHRQDTPFEKLTRYYCIFSTSGFSRELTEQAAAANNVWLIDAEDVIPA